ncbi:site-2 protease family protein [Sporosarcina sp. FSL K6-1522]|uniref:site-2 protease family protein n=1 Tax=Sporosarcina sp. FSL K6-1522 TaxID=2921554 RepID=UPI00315B03A3
MKFRLHPILLPFFLFLIVTGGWSMYALLFLSLLLHEVGHLIVAWLMHMRVRSCTIMPYGGELVIVNRHLASKKAQVLVALGGPAATLLLLVVAVIVPFPGDDAVIRIQVALLCINLLPILPLDGGQVLCLWFESEDAVHRRRSFFLGYSILFLAMAIFLLTSYLPATMPYILLAIFLLIQNISVLRYQKYDKAYREIIIKRLT